MTMPSFEDSLRQMLAGALMAYARLRDFTIEAKAAEVFADRAVKNIKKSESSDKDRYFAALAGVVNLPDFVDVMESSKKPKVLADVAAANSMIDAILTLKLPCIYPWCRSRR